MEVPRMAKMTLEQLIEFIESVKKALPEMRYLPSEEIFSPDGTLGREDLMLLVTGLKIADARGEIHEILDENAHFLEDPEGLLAYQELLELQDKLAELRLENRKIFACLRDVRFNPHWGLPRRM